MTHRRRCLQIDARGKLLVAKPPADTALLAHRLLATKIDLWIDQEVENVDTVREFNRDYLDSRHDHVAVIDGNDAARFINVGILSGSRSVGSIVGNGPST